MIDKPTPPIDAWTEPFWTAVRQEKLLLQFCPHCREHIFYPRRYCPTCLAEDMTWVEAAGRGKVYAFTVVQNNAPSAFLPDMPFVIGIVILNEGVRMMSNIVGCDPETIYSEMPVVVTFEKLNDDMTLPKFKPAVSV
ncbi:MAG: Zn-ribbon domain-containing OB-fold protein [Anaerolineae bacterium]